jgi:tRNA (guanine10-N2)-methyltransferase
MEYLIRFAQVHESFRLAEIQAIAITEHIDLRIVEYSDAVGILMVYSLQSIY